MNIKQILFSMVIFIHNTVFAEEAQLLLAPPSYVVIRGTVTIEAEVVPRTYSIPITIFVDGEKYCWDVGKVSCKWDTRKVLSGEHSIIAIANMDSYVLKQSSIVRVISDKLTASSYSKSCSCVTIK